MLEHQKKVLTSVSENPELFKKELEKSLQWLNHEEQNQFKEWVKEKYESHYPKIIAEFLSTSYNFAS
nr:hypothetical protein [uncultured Carboxylicivirga sp.]